MRLESALALKEELIERHFGGGNSAALAPNSDSEGFPGTSLGVFEFRKDNFGIEIGVSNKKRAGELGSQLLELGAIAKVPASEKRLVATGKIVAAAASNGQQNHSFSAGANSPIRPGDSTSHRSNPSGTLACYLARDDQPSWIGVLSNNHIFSFNNRIGHPDSILSAGTTDGGVHPRHRYATLRMVLPIDSVAGAANLYDAADAEVERSRQSNSDNRLPANPRIVPGIGILSGNVVKAADIPNLVASGAMVYKRGRTSKETAGKISSSSVNISVQYPFANSVTFDPVLAFRGHLGYQPFAKRGDSGSLVAIKTGKTDPASGLDLLDAVALIFAVTTHQYNATNPHTTYAIPLESILKQMGTRIY